MGKTYFFFRQGLLVFPFAIRMLSSVEGIVTAGIAISAAAYAVVSRLNRNSSAI